jgi:endonuclease YncB( thermonuclease family)
MMTLTIIITAVLILLLPTDSMAHGGGLDVLGCHHDKKQGGYHCHRGQLAGQDFSSKTKALKSLQGGVEIPDSQIKGKPRIVDGDTIHIANNKIRLHGIDAPEMKQTCQKADGSDYRCEEMATLSLAEIIETHWVTCKGETQDRYKRRIAVCFAGPQNINAKMVRRGWAIA